MSYKDDSMICIGKTNPSVSDVNETIIILHFPLLVTQNKSRHLNQFSDYSKSPVEKEVYLQSNAVSGTQWGRTCNINR